LVNISGTPWPAGQTATPDGTAAEPQLSPGRPHETPLKFEDRRSLYRGGE
jgi:hypothetical protein